MSEAADEVDELIAEVAGVVAVLAGGSVEETLQRVVDTAVAHVHGCDIASILVVADQSSATKAFSDPAVIAIDQMQVASGEGPCLEVLVGAGTVYASDLGTDPRYPRFGPQAESAGIRSAVAYQLLVDGLDGALNLYARLAHAYGSHDRAKGMILATLASTALDAAVDRRGADEHRADLQRAILTREVIGQAQGILMERERITAEQAFDILRRASQHLNEKLRDVAQALVDTGEDPDVGPARTSTPPTTPGTVTAPGPSSTP